jgi:hypothetical protein
MVFYHSQEVMVNSCEGNRAATGRRAHFLLDNMPENITTHHLGSHPNLLNSHVAT